MANWRSASNRFWRARISRFTRSPKARQNFSAGRRLSICPTISITISAKGASARVCFSCSPLAGFPATGSLTGCGSSGSMSRQFLACRSSSQSKRTTLLDSSEEDPHTRVAWLRNLAARAPSEDVVPLSQVLAWTAPRTLASLAAIRDKGFLYAKIGYQDAWSFPELLPGSIVRVRPISMDDLLQRPRGEQSKGLILIEHARGLCCCRIRIVGAQRIAIVATQMPYAQVEFNVPQEARIIGAADLEIRNLLRPEPPAVPKEFAKRWRPEVLPGTLSRLGPLLRQARLRMGLSFRAASAISREIANLLDDLRYFTAAGSLSDYESGNIPPRHIHKIITFCVVYSLDLQTVLQTLGLSPQDAGQEPIPQVLTGGPLSAASETALGDG